MNLLNHYLTLYVLRCFLIYRIKNQKKKEVEISKMRRNIRTTEGIVFGGLYLIF
ncbi:hypothetical protein C2G38_2074269 [Gigaspora rosea]|uniref:Uncharacterized protein n=1 Tax=Gigaspora rosea TaxID=44941 RepID=A0A397VV79_9GLOM|nr:hypothetical protein C2G38_2074269 [Gigaspora rosea]